MTIIKLLSNPITLIIITILGIVFYLSLEKTENKRVQSAETISQLEQEVTSLESEVETLNQEVTQADYSLNKEKIIRNELLRHKPGEYVVQLPDIIEESDNPTKNDNSQKPIDEWRTLFFDG